MSTIFILILVAALIIGINEVVSSKRKKENNNVNRIPVKAAWFDDSRYLAENPDVAAANLDPWTHYVEYGRQELRAPYNGLAVDSSKPVIADMPKANLIIMDDALSTLVSEAGGDSNAGQDGQLQLGLCAADGRMPKIMGASCNRKTSSVGVLQKVLEVMGLNILVSQGHTKYEEADSQLGRDIIRLSKLGRLDIDLGGPACDLAWALKNGAAAGNIYVWALLGGTWNAQDVKIDKGLPAIARRNMKASADYVRKVLGNRLVEIGANDYRKLLDRKNLPTQYKDTSAFIERWRKFSGWNFVNTNWLMNMNRSLNGSAHDAGSFRAADVFSTAARHGITSIDDLFRKAEKGLTIIEDRKKAGAVRTVPDVADSDGVVVGRDTRVIDRNTFNPSTCRVYVDPVDGGSRNPFNYQKTGNITFLDLQVDKYTVRHSKTGVWQSLPYKPGRPIDGTDGVVFYNRDDGYWYVWMFEYRVVEKAPRPKGWGNILGMQESDPVGFICSTNTRNGEWDVKGQRPERTDIRWVVAK